MELQITDMRDGVLEDVARLYHAYREYFAPHAATDSATSAAFLRDRVERDECRVFAATAGGRAVGFITLYPLWSSWYCKPIWFLSDLYVDENARGQGAATKLVERVKAFARETGASSIMVELPKKEPHLYTFYARCGFYTDPVFDLARYAV